jgi:hypothetical protein
MAEGKKKVGEKWRSLGTVVLAPSMPSSICLLSCMTWQMKLSGPPCLLLVDIGVAMLCVVVCWGGYSLLPQQTTGHVQPEA